jgi:tetrahydromethanopterin S-methyltransferase subunit F
MSGYTTKQIAGITAGAVTALVIIGWLVVLALAFLSA